MILTEKQKEKLKKKLTSEEFEVLMKQQDDTGEFLSSLDDLIVSRFDEKDENTPEAEELQCIFDEIYNQN